MKGYRFLLWYLLVVLFVIFSLLTMCSCRSTSTIENNTDIHRLTQLTDRMDSLIHNTSTWQQDIYNKQTSLIDRVKQWEKNDSNHTVIINEKGDTVRERIEVHHYIEKEHNSEKEESETIIHLQSQVDSLIHLSMENKALMDSLLKEHSKETVITKEPSLWEKIKAAVGGYAIVIIILAILIFSLKLFLRKRA